MEEPSEMLDRIEEPSEVLDPDEEPSEILDPDANSEPQKSHDDSGRPGGLSARGLWGKSAGSHPF